MRVLVLPILLLGAAPAAAEVELGFYGGWAGAPDRAVTLEGDDALPDSEGEVAAGNSQLGLRATYWTGTGFGVALDYSRFQGEEGAAPGEPSFGDLSTLTLNGMARFDGAPLGVTPYVGAGLGIASADLEAGGATAEATGPAVSWVAGASLPLGENLAVFGEYEGTYADIEGDTDGGGTLGSDTVTNSINLGVSFSF